MPLLPLLLRLSFAIALVVPPAGGCAAAPAVADGGASEAAAAVPPCHGDHGAPAVSGPDAADPGGMDRAPSPCESGHCECGCPCRAPTALAVADGELAAQLLPIPPAMARTVPSHGTNPPPPTPPPIA